MKGTTNVPGVCVIIKRRGKLLLILREHTGFLDGYYTVPSGHVEPDETFMQAAVRETREEVGLDIDPDDLDYALTAHRRSINDVRVDVYFIARTWSGEVINGEPKLHGEPVWVSMDDLPDNMVPYVADALKAMDKGISYREQDWKA